MTAPKLPRPLGPDDFMPPHYEPRTNEEIDGLARAETMRDLKRSLRRGVGQVIAKLDAMEERERLRRRFVRR